MTSVLLLENDVEIPSSVVDLASFRRWALSTQFPETGRIDYIDGAIEVDMSPENFFFHGTAKGKIYAVLLDHVEDDEMGHLVCDCSRVSDIKAELSAEPDIVLVTYNGLDNGRVKLVPAASGAPDSYVEIEGAPDLVVEVVSDSSVAKDTRRLPVAYFSAGVREYWIVDARGDEVDFQILRRGESKFVPAQADADGFVPSEIMNRAYRLDRRRNSRGHWVYDLNSR